MSAPGRRRGASDSPPRWARALLGALTPPEDRDFLLEDLEEEFGTRCRAQGARAARRWYRTQVILSAGPLVRRRLSSSRLRERYGAVALDGALQDCRHALRSFVRRPGFTLVAVATVALGVGANTAIFSVTDQVLLRGVAGVDGDRLVEISRNVAGGFSDVSYPVYLEISENGAGLEALAALALEPVSVASSDVAEPETSLSLSVTATYFGVLGIEAGVGRFFRADEAAPPLTARVAVVSEPFWRTRLRGDPAAVGSTIRVNGTPVTLVGVGPPGFRGHQLLPVDVFLPLGADIRGLGSARALDTPGSAVVELLGRLEPGASMEVVEASATQLGDRLLQAELGAGPGDFRARVEPWGSVPAVGRGLVSVFFLVLGVVVAAVLVVACINVAGMLLARGVEREGEMAVRQALGAGRLRIARQLLTESLLLFLAGGAAGTLLAAGLVRLLLALEPPLPPGFEVPLEPSLDGRVLAFALALTVLTALLFNAVPALGWGRARISGGLAATGRGGAPVRTRARGVLIGAQTAASTMLLVVAGLFMRSLVAARSFDPGWDASGVWVAEVDMVLGGSDEAEGRALFGELARRVGALPGVESVAFASKLPFAGRSSLGDVIAPGVQPPPGRTGYGAAFARVTPEYFETMGIALRQGRAFGAEDVHGGESVAIVNVRMAELLWQGDAVGERFHIGGGGTQPSFTVVGVVENTATRDLGGAPEPFYYLPHEQWYSGQMALLVRSTVAEGGDLVPRVRSSIKDAAPYVPVERVLPLEDRLSLFYLPQRLAAWVTGVVGALGLLLAAVGVYGVTAFTVGRRVREIAVRLALGAPPGVVLLGVLLQGMRAPLIGAAAGALLALGVGRVASAFLGTISPWDPAALGGALATLGLAALAAALSPALRAARMDPARTLSAD